MSYVPAKGVFDPSASLFFGAPSGSRKFGYMLNLTLSQRNREYGRQDVSNWILETFDGQPAYIPSQVRNNSVYDIRDQAIFAVSL